MRFAYLYTFGVATPNPFTFGRPATGEAFTGRQRELALLVALVRGRQNVVVSSPRRYGKTSLLLRAQEELAAGRPDAAIVSTNVLVCRDIDTLASRLAAGAYRIPGGRWHRSRQALAEFTRRLRLRPQVTLGEDGKPVFGFGGLSPRDADLVIEDIYALLASESGHRPCALVLDEFQAITRHGAHLPDLFKGLADEHPQLSLVVAGSQHHLMEALVLGRQAPLYGMAERLALGPIPRTEMIGFLVARASAGGREMDEVVASRIVEVAGPVPNDIQRLAWETFNLGGRRLAEHDVQQAFEESVDQESSAFADRLAELTPAQARVLIGIAGAGEVGLFSAEFARSVGLASGASVKRAVEALEAAELVGRRPGERRLAVVDPYFAEWLRRASART